MSGRIFPYHPAVAFGDRIEFTNNTPFEQTSLSLAQIVANFCEELLAESSIKILAHPSVVNEKEIYIQTVETLKDRLTQAGRIALICTLILPLFALIYKAIYRGITLEQLTLSEVKDPNANKKRNIEERSNKREIEKEKKTKIPTPKTQLENSSTNNHSKESSSNASSLSSSSKLSTEKLGKEKLGTMTLRELFTFPEGLTKEERTESFRKRDQIIDEFFTYTYSKVERISIPKGEPMADWIWDCPLSIISGNDPKNPIIGLNPDKLPIEAILLQRDDQLDKLKAPSDPSSEEDSDGIKKLQFFLSYEIWCKKCIDELLLKFSPGSFYGSQFCGGGMFDLPQEIILPMLPDWFFESILSDEYGNLREADFPKSIQDKTLKKENPSNTLTEEEVTKKRIQTVFGHIFSLSYLRKNLESFRAQLERIRLLAEKDPTHKERFEALKLPPEPKTTW